MGLPVKKEEPLTMTIDKFGRVVIPQPVREALHLLPGTKLKIAQETETTVVLKVVKEEPIIELRNGWPVIRCKDPKVDIVEMIKRDREERDKKIMGFYRK